METIRYSLISKQDLKLGTATFEVVLADGRTVQVDEVDIGKLLEQYPIKSYATAILLPTTNVAKGSLARVDADGFLYLYNGSSWTAVGSSNSHTHAASQIVSGQLVNARGGTGLDTSATVQGALLYFNGAGTMAELTPGTSGQFLQTNGAAANVSWGTIAALTGTWRSIGQNSFNNTGSPNSIFDMDADVVVLRNSSDEYAVRFNPGAAISNDVSVAGSVANGRDQAAAFTASSWVHFYWIWNGSTLATVSSATAPPTGPTFPSGYTHWCYAGAVYFSAASQLVPTHIKGAMAFYDTAQSALSGGNSAVEATVSLTALIPPNALSAQLMASISTTSAATEVITVDIRHITGKIFHTLVTAAHNGLHGGGDSASILIPNMSQSVIYIKTAGASNANLAILVQGYGLPNGG